MYLVTGAHKYCICVKIAFALTSRGSLRDKLEYAWRIYDMDQNGQIDKEELRRVLDAMLVLLNVKKSSGSSDSVVDECLKILDTNNDGVISKGTLVSSFI